MAAKTLRLVSLNTWKCDGQYGQRLQAMQDQLKLLDPDVLLLQEVFALPHGAPDTALALARHLGLHCTAAPTRRKLRQFQGRWVDSFSGMAVLSRRAPTRVATLSLPSTTADGGRVAQWCLIPTPGAPLLVGNVHLTHLRQASALRAQQLQSMLEHSLFQQRSGTALLAGDFNASLAAPELQALMAAPWNLRSAFAPQPPKVTHTTDAGQGLDLDHILLAPGPRGAYATVVQAQLVLDGLQPRSTQRVSDHAGVAVTLAV